MYTAVYPLDSFYFSEYEEVTLRKAPQSATIINKTATYPDFHGDYASASLISLSKGDYTILLNELNKDRRLTKNEPDNFTGGSELNQVMGRFTQAQITDSFTRYIDGRSDHYLFIGFLDDKRTIVVFVSQS